jgi:hypothetical protein
MELLSRGVWTAPWLGPSGESVLVAVTSEAKLLLPPEAIPEAQLQSRRAFLWHLLDQFDPELAADLAAAKRRRRTLKVI